MTWVKLDDTFTDHPKVLAVGDEAAWLYVAGLCHCSRHLTDGFIAEAVLGRLTGLPAPAEMAARLVTHGLWDTTTGGWLVHDYAEHQRTRAEVEAEREKGKQRAARSREVRANRGRTTPARSGGVTEPDTEADADTETPPSLVDQIVDGVFAKVLADKQRAGEGIRSVDGFRKWWDDNEGEGCRKRAELIARDYRFLNLGQYVDTVRSPVIPPWASSMRRESA